MKLEQSFEVAAPLERVWQTLIDVEHVAPCLPGAAVTGRNEDGSYNGTFTVKIGPTTASYSGRLEMESVDEASHTATMQAQGTDKRGQGGAKATIYSRLAPADGTGTRVEVVTDYHITGRLARFGRGGMIEDISERLLKEFAKRLQNSLSAPADTTVSSAPADTTVSSPADAPPAEAVTPPPAGSEAHAPSAAGSAQTGETPFPGAAPPPPPAGDTPAPPPAPAGTPGPPATAVTPAPPLGTGTPAPPPGAAGTPGPPGTAATPAPPLGTGTPAPPPGAGATWGTPAAADTPAPSAAAGAPPSAAAGAPPSPPASAATPAPERPSLSSPPQPSEPMQGLSVVGSVMWARIKRTPGPAAAAAGAAVGFVLGSLARRRR